MLLQRLIAHPTATFSVPGAGRCTTHLTQHVRGAAVGDSLKLPRRGTLSDGNSSAVL